MLSAIQVVCLFDSPLILLSPSLPACSAESPCLSKRYGKALISQEDKREHVKLIIQITFDCTFMMVPSESLLTCFAGAQQLGVPLVQNTLLRSSLQRLAEDILPEVDRRGLALPTLTGLRPLVIRPPLSQGSDLSSDLPSSFAFSSQSSNSSR